MEAGGEADYEAIARMAAERIMAAMRAESTRSGETAAGAVTGRGAGNGDCGDGDCGESVLVFAGSYARPESLRAVTEAAFGPGARLAILDPSGRDWSGIAPAHTKFACAEPCIGPGSRLLYVGLSFFELEALASPAAGSEAAEALAFFLGTSRPVILGADHAERFRGFKAVLAARLRAATTALSGLGVDCSMKAASRPSGSPGKPLEPSHPGAGQGPKLVSAELIRSMDRGSTLWLGEGTILTPLARDEARDRGIRLVGGSESA